MSGPKISDGTWADGAPVLQHRWARFPLILGTALLAVGCFDQILVPLDDVNERILLINDEFLLDQRARYTDEVIEIDSVFDPASGPSRAARAFMKGPSVTLRLKAEVNSPTVSGQLVQATSVESTNKSRAVVSYNVRGASRVGAVDYFDKLDKKRGPKLKSSITFNDADVSSVTAGGGFVYATEATSAPGFAVPAVLERIKIDRKKFSLTDNLRVPLTSFAATSAVIVGSIIYATSGDRGGVFAFGASDLSKLAEYPLDDARWVAMDNEGGRVVVAQGTPGRISTFTAGDFTAGTLQLINTFPFPGAITPQSKSTVEVTGNLAIVAAGSEGVQMVCLDSGAIVASVPRPDPASLGLSSSVVMTNAVTVDHEVMFISNGEAGVYVAVADRKFKDYECSDVPEIEVLGSLRFSNLESVNHVAFRGKHLFIAAGIGGIKVVEVKVKR